MQGLREFEQISYQTSEESNPRAAARTVDFGVSGHFGGVLGRGTGRKRFGSTVGFMWADSQYLATILDPFRTIFANLGPDCVSETRTLCLLLRQDRCLLLRQDNISQAFDSGSLAKPAHGSDYVRHGTLEPDHPPLAHAPRDEITACETSPHFDDMSRAISE